MTQQKQRYASDLMAGQVALVTGSGSGMGRATALEMASCGARLALFARREDPLQETAEMIRAAGGEAFVVPGDTRNEVGEKDCDEDQADLCSPHMAELLATSGQNLAHATQVHGPLPRLHAWPWPFVEGCPRGTHCLPDIFGPGLRRAVKMFLGNGRDQIERFLARRLDPVAADVKLTRFAQGNCLDGIAEVHVISP